MILRTFALITGLAFATSFAQAATDKTPKVKADAAEKHAAIIKKIDHLKVQFVQKSYRKLRNRTTERKGVAYFARPASFRWMYETKGQPTEAYYYDSNILAHYQKADNSVTCISSKSAFNKELQNVVNLVLDANKLFTDFKAIETKEVKNDTAVTLVPLDKGKTDIAKIFVQVSNNRGYVKEVKIDYNDGNATTFDFKNPRFTPISADTFQFKNPSETPVKRVGC